MKRKWMDAMISIVFGVIMPCALLAVIPERKHDDHIYSQIEESSATSSADEVIIINILLDDGSITKMPIDDYLTAVVLQEMPAEFETEALKAQAVVARTYTLRGHNGNAKHPNAAVCTKSSCCQGYCPEEKYLLKGGNVDLLEKVKKAVCETSGEVLKYHGELIEATYFSCSGGYTEDAKAVWGVDVPYLQAKESPGEEQAAHYTDTVTLSTDTFKDLLGINPTKRPESWVESCSYTDGGGIASVRICGKEYAGTDIRRILGLRSTAFVITIIGDTVTITTKGFGHRVGMSQYGADAMALKGNNYQQILSYYYPGTELAAYEGDND